MKLIKCAAVGLQNPTFIMSNTSCLCGKDYYCMIIGGWWLPLGVDSDELAAPQLESKYNFNILTSLLSKYNLNKLTRI